MSDVWLAALPWLAPRLMEDLVTALALLLAPLLLWLPMTLVMTLLLAVGVLVKNVLSSLRNFLPHPRPAAAQQSWTIGDRSKREKG